MKNIILLGPPGCGKGTQAQILQKEQNFIQLSTGELLRDAIKNHDSFSQSIKKIIDRGELVSDSIIMEVIEKKVNNIVKDGCSGIIFDGFPRTIEQAKLLSELFTNIGTNIYSVIVFNIERNVLIKRITGRYNCAKCKEGYNDFFKPTTNEGICDICNSTDFIRRSDDNVDALKKRLESYDEVTIKLLSYYKEYNVVVQEIDATQGIQYTKRKINTMLNL